jgi:tetratricopeptide (TPR) repeat protein
VKRVLLALLAVIVCVAGVYGYSATRRERTHRYLIDRGDAALSTDDTFVAIESFSGAIALKGNSMLGYLKRGETYLRRHQLDSAARGAGQELDPPAESAMRDLSRASEIDPLAPRPLELLGDVNYSLSRFDRAAEHYQTYVRLDDRSPRVLYKLALARYRGGRHGAAVGALQQAVAINDQFAEAYYLLGLCYRDLQLPGESLRALESSVRIAPAMLYAREELADLYGRLGRVDDRLAQLEALLRLDPGPSREVTLGLAYARAGQFDRGITTLGRAAERYPDHADTYVALGRVWLEKAQVRPDRVDLGKALGALEGVLGADDSSEARTLFGRALLLAQDEEGAERMLQQATESFPADPLAFYYLAEAAERSGHTDVARRALLDYRALEGDDADPHRRAALATRVADLSSALGDAPTAVTWYQRAIDAAPQDATLLVRVADAQMKTGDFGAARAALALALEKDPANRAARLLQRRLK